MGDPEQMPHAASHHVGQRRELELGQAVSRRGRGKLMLRGNLDTGNQADLRLPLVERLLKDVPPLESEPPRMNDPL